MLSTRQSGVATRSAPAQRSFLLAPALSVLTNIRLSQATSSSASVPVGPNACNLAPHALSSQEGRWVGASAAQQAASAPAPELTAGDIAIKNPVCFKQSTSVKEAVKVMLDNNISGAPVVDDEGRLVGILSESDIIWKGAGAPLDHYLIPPTYVSIIDSIIQLRDTHAVEDDLHKILSRTVGDAMTREVAYVKPSAPLSAACQLMLARKVNRLPVVDNGIVVGVITRHDMLQGIYQLL